MGLFLMQPQQRPMDTMHMQKRQQHKNRESITHIWQNSPQVFGILNSGLAMPPRFSLSSNLLALPI